MKIETTIGNIFVKRDDWYISLCYIYYGLTSILKIWGHQLGTEISVNAQTQDLKPIVVAVATDAQSPAQQEQFQEGIALLNEMFS